MRRPSANSADDLARRLKIEEFIRSAAPNSLYVWKERPFAKTPTDSADKLKRLVTATERLLRELDSLVPKKAPASFEENPFDFDLVVAIQTQYSFLGLIRSDHWARVTPEYANQTSSSDFRTAAPALLYQELKRFRDAASESLRLLKPGRGRSIDGTLDGRAAHAITRALVREHRMAFGKYPAISKNGWATALLEEVFETNGLQVDANSCLRAEIALIKNSLGGA